MRQKEWAVRGIVIMGVVALSFAMSFAQDRVERISEAPPSGVSAEVSSAVASEGYAVTVGGDEIARLWFRKGFPQEGVSSALGVTFGQIAPGTLIGVVKLNQEWEDYKGMPVQAGVYTLRFGQEPADGNHMGVSVYRDFLQLIPVSEDQALNASYSPEELVELSSKASGTPHPAVMALFPVWDEISETSLIKNEVDQWTVAWKDGELTLGVVVEGHGEM